jgi:hypothetical protein
MRARCPLSASIAHARPPLLAINQPGSRGRLWLCVSAFRAADHCVYAC